MDSLLDLLGEKPKPKKSLLDVVHSQIIPQGREEGLNQQVREGFKGDSKYDTGLGYRIDQDQLRAINQPTSHEIVNAAIKTVPGIGLGILENAGYLAELVSGDKDYTNVLTEIASKGRQSLEKDFPAYRKSNQVFDLGDSAWWINHGQGLVESIGEFFVTGVGVGKGLSTSAKLLNQAIKGGELGNKVLQGAAQLGTASTLAYTEGAMSGAQVYKDTYEKAINDNLSESKAVQKASDAASKTVRLNTIINTGVNITSLSPIFKSFNQLDQGIKSTLKREAKESLGDYVKRLTFLEAQGVPKASTMRKLALEALQEGVEEDVNLFAENEGYIEGGLRKPSSKDSLGRFLDTSLTQEGALNFLLGAVGGIGQTAGMEHLPLRTYIDEQGNQKRVSASTLEDIEKGKTQKETIASFRQDIQNLQKYQEDLNQAVKKGNKDEIDLAKNNLFNIGLLKSLKNETSDELSNEMQQIASTDNIKLGPDGLTDAMKSGLSENPDDNEYKLTAATKAADIKKLNQEYRNLLANTQNPIQATEAFKTRLNSYALESTISTLNKEIAKTQAEFIQDTDPKHTEIATLLTNIKGRELAIDKLTKLKKTKQAESLKEETNLLKESLKSIRLTNPEYKEASTKTNNNLASLEAAKLVLESNFTEVKEEYRRLKTDPKYLQNKMSNSVKELTQQVDQVQKAKEDKEREINKEFAAQEAEKKVADEAVARQERAKIENLVNRIKETKSQEEILPILHEAGEYSNHPEVAKAILNKNLELSNQAPINVEEIPIPESTLGLSQERNNEEVINDVQENPTIDNSTLDEINKDNSPNLPTYANYNKIAYKAQEQDQSGSTIDPFTINSMYKVLHSPKFNKGARVILGVDQGNKFYEKNKEDVKNVPIGIYYINENEDTKLIGYLPTYKEGMNPQLYLVREYLLKNFPTTLEDKVIYKGTGVLNRGTKQQVATNYAFTPKFLIGRNSFFESGLSELYNQPLLNKGAKDGIVYTLNITSNGKHIALPIDIDKVGISKVDSTLKVLDLYFKGTYKDKVSTLSQQEQEFIITLQERFNFDPTKPADLKEYFETIFHSTNLNQETQDGRVNIEAIKNKKGDKYYVQVLGGGIKFMKEGDKEPTFYGRNDIQNKEKSDLLRTVLLNSYGRVDLAKINSKGKFSFPLLKENLEVEEYTKGTYNDHVASITSTNIVSVKLSDTEQTAFVQPNLYVSLNIENSSEKIEKTTLPNGEKAVNLAESKTKKGFKSLVTIKQDQLKKQPVTIVTNNEVIDKETLERYKERCR